MSLTLEYADPFWCAREVPFRKLNDLLASLRKLGKAEWVGSRRSNNLDVFFRPFKDESGEASFSS